MTREPAGSSLENEEATPMPRSAPSPAVATEFEDVGTKGLAAEIDELVGSPPRWRVSHLMIATAVAALVIRLGISLGTAAILLMPMALVVMAVTSAFVAARLRSSRQEALLSMLAIAAERGMPLAPALESFADQFRGRAQRRILGVVDGLNDGKPLHQALIRPFRIVSRDASLMARVGDESGRLGPAMRLVGASRAQQTGAWSAVAGRLAYLLAVVSVAEGISGFNMYFIMPKFEAIFADFGVPLPEVTRWMISGTQVLIRYAWVAWPLFLLQLILIIFLPFSFGGWLNYRVPVFDRLFGRRHTALALRALSVVIEAGRPIGLGLGILADQYPATWFRRRLARASKDMQAGADWIDALWRRGVIRRADAEVLASAATVGNLVWACRTLADTAERRQRIRMQMLVQALFPVAVLAIGAAVAVLCLGYFVPLVQLIERLSDV